MTNEVSMLSLIRFNHNTTDSFHIKNSAFSNKIYQKSWIPSPFFDFSKRIQLHIMELNAIIYDGQSIRKEDER